MLRFQFQLLEAIYIVVPDFDFKPLFGASSNGNDKTHGLIACMYVQAVMQLHGQP